MQLSDGRAERRRIAAKKRMRRRPHPARVVREMRQAVFCELAKHSGEIVGVDFTQEDCKAAVHRALGQFRVKTKVVA
jgi:hypothetical protein